MLDRYTKAVLTVIAAALVAIVAQNASGPAIAQLGGGGCGGSFNPCYVTARDGLNVYVLNR